MGPSLPTLHEVEQEMAGASGYELLKARYDVWATHPDERVVIRMVEWRSSSIAGRPEEWGMPLLRRAREVNEREGILWNPLLDVLASQQAWPSARGLMRISQPGEAAPKRDFGPTPEAQMSALVPWVQSATREELESFLEFRAPQAWKCVARHATTLRAEDVCQMLEVWDELGSDFLENAGLNEEALQGIYDWSLTAILENRESKVQALRLAEKLEAKGVVLSAERQERALEALGHTVPFQNRRTAGSFLTLQRELSTDMLFRILEQETMESTRGALLLHPRATPDLWERVISEEKYPEALLAEVVRQAPRELLLRFIPRVASDESSVRSLLKSPKADLEVLRAVARSVGSVKIRELLLKKEESRGDAEVRRHLSRSTSPDILEELLSIPGLGAAEFVDLLRKLVKRDPKRAVSLLEKVPIPAGARVPAADLLPLFGSPEVEVREKAMRALARLRDQGCLSPEGKGQVAFSSSVPLGRSLSSSRKR